MSRYLSILVLIALIFIACMIVETAFRWSGSGLSLTDTKGAGQVALFLVIIPFLLGFALKRGGGPATFLKPYAANLKRALAGFATMWLFAVAVMIATYAALGALGYVGWSSEAWAAFSGRLLYKTVVALLVVVVLAVTEEMIFRGFLLRHLRFNDKASTTILALVVGSLIFSVSHLISHDGAWTAADLSSRILGLFLLGGLFAVTYVATGSIACSIGMHSGLLGFKVFLRRTDLLTYHPDAWWLGTSSDLRLAPGTWFLMILVAAIVWSIRHWLRRRFYIEPVVADWDRP